MCVQHLMRAVYMDNESPTCLLLSDRSIVQDFSFRVFFFFVIWGRPLRPAPAAFDRWNPTHAPKAYGSGPRSTFQVRGQVSILTSDSISISIVIPVLVLTRFRCESSPHPTTLLCGESDAALLMQ